MDAATVTLGGVTLLVALFGGFRLRIGDVRLSLMSAPRVLVAVVVLAAIRHALVRRDPVHRRVGRGLGRLWGSDDLRAVLPVWALSRFGALAVGFLALASFGIPWDNPPFRVYENEWLNLPARMDTGWYFSVATEGYLYNASITEQQNIAFMPALPMLMRVGGKLIGEHPLLAGQAIVLLACLWAFVYVFRLAREALGDPEKAALAVGLLAAYPFAVFLGAVYTESLFLLAAAGGFYHARRQEPWPTLAFALLAGFSRPNGFLLSLPLALAVIMPMVMPTWRAWRTATPERVGAAIKLAWPTLLAAAGAVLGVAVFSAYIWTLAGRPFAWLESHAAWGRSFEGVASFVVGPYRELERRGVYEFVRSLPIDTMNGVGAFMALAASVPVTVRYGLAYGVFILINLLPPLMVGGWLSIGRVTVGLFPVFIWLADVIPARQRSGWLVGFAVAQGLAAALFYSWRPFL